MTFPEWQMDMNCQAEKEGGLTRVIVETRGRVRQTDLIVCPAPQCLFALNKTEEKGDASETVDRGNRQEMELCVFIWADINDNQVSFTYNYDIKSILLAIWRYLRHSWAFVNGNQIVSFRCNSLRNFFQYHILCAGQRHRMFRFRVTWEQTLLTIQNKWTCLLINGYFQTNRPRISLEAMLRLELITRINCLILQRSLKH